MHVPRQEPRLPPCQALCVHGAGAGGWEWAIWDRAFGARSLPLRAPDLMPAASGLASTRFEDYRSQVVAWANVATRESGQAPALIGASLGGLLALSSAAALKPSALILINPMPPRGILAKPLGKPNPAIRHWGCDRSISGTRRSMPDADDAACLHAFRRWRDESGLALEEARQGVAVAYPNCPVLVLASDLDDDVPLGVSRELALRCGGDFQQLRGCSHVGPLLGRHAARIAGQAADWLLAQLHARTTPVPIVTAIAGANVEGIEP